MDEVIVVLYKFSSEQVSDAKSNHLHLDSYFGHSTPQIAHTGVHFQKPLSPVLFTSQKH